MGWFVHMNGQGSGPYADADMVQMVAAGQVNETAHVCLEGTQTWLPVAQSPFQTKPKAAPQAAPSGDGLGYAILLLPLAAAAFMWFRITTMNLLQDPGGTLTMLGAGTIVVTAILMASEASQVGMGKLAVEKGKMGTGPAAWFIAAIVMWAIAFPWYLSKRRWYGKQNLVVGGVLVALVFVGSWYVLGSAIDHKKSEIRENLRGLAP